MKEILFIKAEFEADWILRWVELMKILMIEMDRNQNIDQQAAHNLVNSWFILSHKKTFGAGKLVQRVRVYVDHYE